MGEGGTIPFMGMLGEKFPEGPVHDHGRARSEVECARAERVLAPADGQAADGVCRARVEPALRDGTALIRLTGRRVDVPDVGLPVELGLLAYFSQTCAAVTTESVRVGSTVLERPFAVVPVFTPETRTWNLSPTVGPSGLAIRTQGSASAGQQIFSWGSASVRTAWRITIGNSDGCGIESYSVPCGGAELHATDSDPGFLGQLRIRLFDASPVDSSILFVGAQEIDVPTPFGCPLVVAPFAAIPLGPDQDGSIGQVVLPPNALPIPLVFQGATAEFATADVRLTNGVAIECP